MRVTVEFFSTFCEIVGSPRLQIDLPAGTDLAGLLDAVFAQGGSALRHATLGADGRVASSTVILVNGHSCTLRQGLATPIADGDVVSFLVHIAGG